MEEPAETSFRCYDQVQGILPPCVFQRIMSMNSFQLLLKETKQEKKRQTHISGMAETPVATPNDKAAKPYIAAIPQQFCSETLTSLHAV